MNRNYENSIKVLTDCSCKTRFSGSNMLLICKVIPGQNPELEISATDIQGNLWQLLITFNDFQAHIEKIGFLNSEWDNYFKMMKEAFESQLISGEIVNHTINLHIDYPIGEAKIRGTFNLKHVKNAPPAAIASLVFDYIQKLEQRMLKRPRELSSEIKSQAVEPLKAKPKVQKKKKPKQIGSKII